MGLVVILLCGVAVNSAKVKRSYSDQSVRGYLTEVCNCYMQKIGVSPLTLQLICFSELVGGTKCAKRNFNSYFVVNALNGRIAGEFVLNIGIYCRKK